MLLYFFWIYSNSFYILNSEVKKQNKKIIISTGDVNNESIVD